MTVQYLARKFFRLQALLAHFSRLREVLTLSSESVFPDNDFGGLDGPLRKPPQYLLALGSTSVLIGLLLGIQGFRISTNGASNSQQYFLGGLGYIFSALIPIVVLQIAHVLHEKHRKNDEAGSYDVFAGNELNKRIRAIVVPAGLISAALPIWVMLSPIAEKLA